MTSTKTTIRTTSTTSAEFELCNRRFFWKIDLYEEPGVKSENGEPVVNRVLTIMLADEY